MSKTTKSYELNPDEVRLLQAYRGMDLRRRHELLPFLEDTAEHFPLRLRPAFTLIVGGAS